MSVEFEEPPVVVGNAMASKKKFSFSALLIKTGLVKTEATAQLILLVVAVLLIITSGFLFFRSNSEPPAPTPAQTVL